MVNDVEILCKTVQCQVINFFDFAKRDGGDIAFDPGGGGPCLRLLIDFRDFLGPCLICVTFDGYTSDFPLPHFPPFFFGPTPFSYNI